MRDEFAQDSLHRQLLIVVLLCFYALYKSIMNSGLKPDIWLILWWNAGPRDRFLGPVGRTFSVGQFGGAVFFRVARIGRAELAAIEPGLRLR